MSTKPRNSKDPDIIASYAALRRAAKRALRIGLETKTPVWVVIDGKIVDLTKHHHLPHPCPHPVRRETQ